MAWLHRLGVAAGAAVGVSDAWPACGKADCVRVDGLLSDIAGKRRCVMCGDDHP